MQIKKAMEQQQVAHAMVSSIYQQEMSRLARVSGHHHPLLSPNNTPFNLSDCNVSPQGRRESESESSIRNDFSNGRNSKEMVERIYRQELMKLAQAAKNAGNMAACSMYQQELHEMTRKAQTHDQTEPGEIRRSRTASDMIKMEPADSTVEDNLNINNNNGPIDLSKHSSSAPTTPTSSDKSPTENAHPQGSAFFLVQPKVNGHANGFENNQFVPYSTPECVSPLQRMQNIANSLMSRPHLGMAAAKPLRAVLPAITQEQFDKYANISTDDLVKQIKETLSQYSISQRLFGESVLGLSQGSVSDLLARPKPWHMLTQKGREPFIRMQIFLEDTEAIPKLVASQYHIPPEKLMRSASKSNEIAQRRRRSSVDERSYDSSSMPKRPRVFFTEEQKDKLRLAYNQDPYPNQGTIETLANELNVGVKTVINWFHNHRMRAKQQQHIGNMQGGSNFSEGNSSNPNIKLEPDDSSLHSDISSLSGDTSQFSTSFNGNEPNNQWLFPRFEPAAMHKMGRSHEQQNGRDQDDSGSVTSEKGENKTDEEDDCSYPVFNDIDENSNEEQNQNHNESCQNVYSGVNKRKRSNPKYVSEGRELDKTKNLYSGTLKSCLSKDEGVELDDDLEKENESDNIDLNIKAQNGQHLNKIVKLQKAIDSADEDWDNFDNVPSIEKLQKNLQHSPQTGTWEF